MSSKTTGKRLATAERRIQAVQMRIEGRTFAQIGEALGVTAPRAYQLVKEALSRYAADEREQVTELRACENARLDELHAAIWPKATRGDYGAVDRVLRIMERRARLCGLDAPAKIAQTDPSGQSVSAASPAPVIVPLPPDMTVEEWTQIFGPKNTGRLGDRP